jgi:hypothetical protein
MLQLASLMSLLKGVQVYLQQIVSFSLTSGKVICACSRCVGHLQVSLPPQWLPRIRLWLGFWCADSWILLIAGRACCHSVAFQEDLPQMANTRSKKQGMQPPATSFSFFVIFGAYPYIIMAIALGHCVCMLLVSYSLTSPAPASPTRQLSAPVGGIMP